MPGSAIPGIMTVDCPAKLNLALAVAPPDPQDPQRLHPIASWMVALSFTDRITVERLADKAGDTNRSTFDLAYAQDGPSPGEIDWPIAEDLVFRAHALVEQHVGRPLPVRVALEKRIPTGAGLGGGSSDAAGMIVALDRLFDLSLGEADRHALASGLGSDVHFALAALSGTTSAIVSGSGDRVEPALRSNAWPIDLVLVLPGFGCPTGPVYAAFDRLVAPAGAIDPEALQRLAHDFSPSSDDLFNDLAAAAAQVQPRLRGLIDRLQQGVFRPVHVTGSGAACFIVASSSQDAAALATQVTADLGVAAIATRTL